MKRLLETKGGRIALHLLVYIVFALGIYGCGQLCVATLGENFMEMIPPELLALIWLISYFIQFVCEEIGDLICWIIEKVKNSRTRV